MREPAHNGAARTAPACVLAGARSPTDENPDPIVQAVSRGSQKAFAVLFDRTVGTIGAELAARLADPQQRVAILAATYVEVWWLAGCHSGTESDVMDWIRQILGRRVADARRAAGRQVEREPRPGRTELELASLLGRPVGRLWPV